MKDYTFAFNIFDILAYIFVEFLFWLIVLVPTEITPDFFFSSALFSYHFTYIQIPFVLLVAYISGHIIAHFGSLFLEKGIIAKILNYPSTNFFRIISDNSASKPNRFFKNYTAAYPEQLATKIKDAYEQITSIKFNHYDAFMFCFHYVKDKSPTTYSRLLIFLQLYDFCRNVSMMFFFCSFILLYFSIFEYPNLYILSIVLFLLSYLFFLRYLKFFRLYGDEVFRSFYNLYLLERSK